MQNRQDIFDLWEFFENFTALKNLQAPQYMTSLIMLLPLQNIFTLKCIYNIFNV